MKQKLRYIFLAVLCIPFACFSQRDSTRKNEFGAGVNFQTRLHYFGRTDSLQSSALIPNIGYQLKNGLYVQGNIIFTQNKVASTTYAGTTLEGGFRFKPSTHFSGNIFYMQVLYKDNSTLPQSALKGQTGINTAITTPIITFNAGGDLKFSKDQTDIGATLGADHIFLLHKPNSHVAFAIDPSFYLYAGTQRFTKSYIERTKFLGIPVGQKEHTQPYDRFNILAYEASAPVVAVAGKFFATVIPSYVMPQNLLEGETGKNLFYLTLGLGVKL
ncbi:hypothetical protein LL912_22620 [Niabella sp. CC-SYL272]|uniref:hypothetical protein n=1 Tax=Niabella agricola TaxID=2891571 RepID=UPI001F292541|nr:hypothetical protein [Niabella agricola]MCF3111598.1 hypothetical protein [Niabella agricola]